MNQAYPKSHSKYLYKHSGQPWSILLGEETCKTTNSYSGLISFPNVYLWIRDKETDALLTNFKLAQK